MYSGKTLKSLNTQKSILFGKAIRLRDLLTQKNKVIRNIEDQIKLNKKKLDQVVGNINKLKGQPIELAPIVSKQFHDLMWGGESQSGIIRILTPDDIRREIKRSNGSGVFPVENSNLCIEVKDYKIINCKKREDAK